MRNLRFKSPGGLWAKLRERLTHATLTEDYGNAAGWILAQGIGRLNRRRQSNQSTSICFCCSTLHAICNIADPLMTETNTVFFYTLYASHLYEFIRRLGFKAFGSSDWRVGLVLLSEAARGNQIVIWIPHLSPLDYSHFVRSLILGLTAFQSVKHIDDGMGFVSNETHIYRIGYLSGSELIHSWDFLPMPSKVGFPATLNRSQFRHALEVVRLRNPSLISQGLARIREISAAQTCTHVNLILAAKLLDADLCLRQLGQSDQPSQTLYIPHYNAVKNDSRLAILFPNLNLAIPEFGLLGIAEVMPSRIFFGVTSSAIFLIELLLRVDTSQAVEFVFVGTQHCNDAHAREVIMFRELLSHYQGQRALKEKDIHIQVL